MPNEVTVSLPDCGIKELFDVKRSDGQLAGRDIKQFWSYKEKELSRQTILKSSLFNRDKFDNILYHTFF